MTIAPASATSCEPCCGFRLNLCQSRLRLKPLTHRATRRVSATERKPDAVGSDTPRHLRVLDKCPNNRYLSLIPEPMDDSRLEGCMVKKPAGTVTLSSEDGEVLIAQVHQSNLPPASAGRVEYIIRM